VTDVGGDGWSLYVAKLDGDGNALWSRSYDTMSFGLAIYGNAISSDAAGNVVVVGQFQGTIDFGAGPLLDAGYGTDGFVLSLDAAGELRWAQQIGGSGYETIQGVTVSAEGLIHVVGTFDDKLNLGLETAGGTDSFVAEIHADGSPSWSRRLGGGGNDFLTAIAAGPGGEIVVAGASAGGLTIGADTLNGSGEIDALVIRLDAAGNATWGRIYPNGLLGDYPLDTINGLSVDAGGNVLLCGIYWGAIDFGGGPLPAPTGATASQYLARLDPDGKDAGSKAILESGAHAKAFFVDRSGNALVAGFHEGVETEVYLARLAE
jgi:hypothetical protein